MNTGSFLATVALGASSLQAQTSLAQLSSPSLDPTTKVYPAPTLSNSPPKADPVMTEELMARLIKRILASKKEFHDFRCNLLDFQPVRMKTRGRSCGLDKSAVRGLVRRVTLKRGERNQG